MGHPADAGLPPCGEASRASTIHWRASKAVLRKESRERWCTWFVVTVSIMGLFGILRLLEVRFGENLMARRHPGLARHAPRPAVSFAVFRLAFVGLLGTLSFCSQDLLIHGTLTSHPITGVILPIATVNAMSVFRIFARLFPGNRRTGFTHIADAPPRERGTLAAGGIIRRARRIVPETDCGATIRSNRCGRCDGSDAAGFHAGQSLVGRSAARQLIMSMPTVEDRQDDVCASLHFYA